MAGGSTAIDYWLVNFGAAASAASISGIYISTDATITTADTLLSTVASPALAANSVSGYYDHQAITLNLPGSLAPGTYYIGGIADYTNAIVESNEANNNYQARQITVTAGGPPVILDLDGNGVDIIPLGSSSVLFDMADGGGLEHTAWVGSNDGLLAIDLAANGQSGPDGMIDQTNEIVFTQWAPGTTSDMQALRQVFDTNHNGKLDAGDARWNEFRIWQDRNSDGVSDPAELKTLDQLGIISIDLNPKGPAQQFADGSVIQGLSTYSRTDGTTGIAGDVTLAYGSTIGVHVLTDGAGSDRFVFSTAMTGGANADTVTGSAANVDRAVLDHAIFAAVGAIGGRAAMAFTSGAEIAALSYDADGSGATAAIQLAALAAHLNLTNNDFLIV